MTTPMTDSQMTRLFNRPMETVLEVLPGWMPMTPLRQILHLILSVLFSPNNINTVFSLSYSEYFGGINNLRVERPTLLLWGTKDSINRPRPVGAPTFLGGTFLRQ